MPTKKRKAAGKARKKQSRSAWAQMVEAMGRISLDTIMFVAGLVLLAISLVMLLSMLSNFQTAAVDQTGVVDGNLEHAANYAGTLGARLSYYMMND
ncbi:MAG: hypothetical protein IKH52_05655, partial [Bacteroidaceae bacterium]|nr:hypothetical protein [Bacteroidaceae bacterium]